MTSQSPWLDQAERILDQGGVVAIPTETVYGLAARIDRESGLQSIFRLKQRPFFDPLIVHVADLQQLNAVVLQLPELACALAETFWPGPLTLILEAHPQLNPLINSGLETVGVRIPRHPLSLELLRRTGPLAAPSANMFGRTSPTCAEHVQSEFGSQVMVLDGGACELGIESTVLQVQSQERRLVILRPGAVTDEDLRAFLTDRSDHFPDWELKWRAGDPQSPGHLTHHYQPQQPLVIVGKNEDLATAREDFSVSLSEMYELVLAPSPQLAARELYAQMRSLSQKPECKLIYVQASHKDSTGLWSSIWDRLNRAATKNYLC